MTDDERTLHLHLPPPQLARAREGRSPLAQALGATVEPLGWRVALHGNGDAEAAEAPRRAGWTLLDRREPLGPRSLCLRQAYLAPFWRVEATHERWRFDVARARFDPEGIDPAEAARLCARWRARLLPDAPPPRREGFVLVPLQGRLLDRRSFQSMSPLAMIEALLEADPRPLRATLHPGESHEPAELAALDALAARHPRLTVTRGGSAAHLAFCDHVVTQNSATAFQGLFLGKRAVLFAGSDFHHAAGSVPRDGLAAAWASLDAPPPPFERYLAWFLRRHAINVAVAGAPERLRARLRDHGVPL